MRKPLEKEGVELIRARKSAVADARATARRRRVLLTDYVSDRLLGRDLDDQECIQILRYVLDLREEDHFVAADGRWVVDATRYAALPVEVRCVTKVTPIGGALLQVAPILSKERALEYLCELTLGRSVARVPGSRADDPGAGGAAPGS
jgi:hypothetical protein